MPGPFPDTTVEAVGTCLRTLAQQPDADAPLASATAATLSSLRAFADRLALRRRFHDPHAHSAHRPADPHAATLFDLLELARLDAIGARWLAGIARNLTRMRPRRRRPAWLAFERWAASRRRPKGRSRPWSRGSCRHPSGTIVRPAAHRDLRSRYAAAASRGRWTPQRIAPPRKPRATGRASVPARRDVRLGSCQAGDPAAQPLREIAGLAIRRASSAGAGRNLGRGPDTAPTPRPTTAS